MDNGKLRLFTMTAGVIALFLVAAASAVLHFSWAQPDRTVQVGLLAGNGEFYEQEGLILAAYEQILKEEGFPHRRLFLDDLEVYGARGLKERFEALIVPEFVNAFMPAGAAKVIEDYVREEGGCVLVVLDAASKDESGSLLLSPLLAGLVGVRYCLAPPAGEKLTYNGFWYFSSAAKGREWGITPGKIDREGAVCSYSYGKLVYEHTRAINTDALVVAFDRQQNTQVPVITEKVYPSGGTALYANMPCGKYKLKSDDLAPRSVLRTFLIRYAKVPRLVNSPGGSGGLVVNLHICSGAYFRPLAVMLMQGLFQSEMPFSIHVTAGPDTYKFGDGMGFDAGNKYRGRPLLEVLQNYGEIGAHGGWAHNFFAFNIKYLPKEKVFDLVDLNFNSLEEVTGRQVLEYSAPGGTHPFWLNKHLEQLGVKAYYYAGDTGSSPSRPRLDADYAGDDMWAFPISPYRQFACLEEMERGKVPFEEVKQWLEDLVEYAAEERVIRTFYTHPSDRRYCTEAIRALEEKALEEQRKGRLAVAPMSQFADFLCRLSRTNWQVKREGYSYEVELENPQGLKDITVALYVGEESAPVVLGSEIRAVREGGWLYLTVLSNPVKKQIRVQQLG